MTTEQERVAAPGWDDYLAALADLEGIRRDAATAVGAQESAAEAARAELAVVRGRIALQRTRLADTATRAGRPVPTFEPGAAEHAEARALVSAAPDTDVVAMVGAAIADARASLDAADAALTTATDRPSARGVFNRWPVGLRLAAPYVWYALLATVVVVMVDTVFRDPVGWWIRLFFALAAPTIAFALGLASSALLYGRRGDEQARRAYRLGVVICAVPLFIGLVFTAVVP